MRPERAKIAALIGHMDDGIGRVIRALKEDGQYENTLIVFTSDNGGELRCRRYVSVLCEAISRTSMRVAIRVPAIFVWPGRVQPGSTSDLVAQCSDLLPSLCEATGARTGAVDGVLDSSNAARHVHRILANGLSSGFVARVARLTSAKIIMLSDAGPGSCYTTRPSSRLPCTTSMKIHKSSTTGLKSSRRSPTN